MYNQPIKSDSEHTLIEALVALIDIISIYEQCCKWPIGFQLEIILIVFLIKAFQTHILRLMPRELPWNTEPYHYREWKDSRPQQTEGYHIHSQVHVHNFHTFSKKTNGKLAYSKFSNTNIVSISNLHGSWAESCTRSIESRNVACSHRRLLLTSQHPPGHLFGRIFVALWQHGWPGTNSLG